MPLYTYIDSVNWSMVRVPEIYGMEDPIFIPIVPWLMIGICILFLFFIASYRRCSTVEG